MISITRRFLLVVTLACSSVLMASASYADKIKVAAIYTLPVEQQWISRIHKALNTAASRGDIEYVYSCLLYTSPSPRDVGISRMPSSA